MAYAGPEVVSVRPDISDAAAPTTVTITGSRFGAWDKSQRVRVRVRVWGFQ